MEGAPKVLRDSDVFLSTNGLLCIASTWWICLLESSKFNLTRFLAIKENYKNFMHYFLGVMDVTNFMRIFCGRSCVCVQDIMYLSVINQHSMFLLTIT